LVQGPKEMDSSSVAPRLRDGKQLDGIAAAAG
jgi:hypothetical protein